MDDPPPLYRDPVYQISHGWPFLAQTQAVGGDVQALLYLALCTFNAGDHVSSLRYYEQAADQNCLEGALNAAKMYEVGMGCEMNIVKACQLMKHILETASESQLKEHDGIKQLVVAYGWYLLGAKTSATGGPQQELPLDKRNPQEGVKWLEKAATDNENGEVAGVLGNLFLTGGHPKISVDFPKGLALLEIAAKLGDGRCAHQLHGAYKIGYKIPVDLEKSRYWLKKSADLGFREAQEEIARCGNAGVPSFSVDTRQAKKEIKNLKREDNIEELLTTDETNKCSNPHCTVVETTDRFDVCVRCKHRKYCGKACQMAHWKNGHKQECRQLETVKDHAKQTNIDMIRNRLMANCVRCGNMECRALENNDTGSFKKCAKCKQTKYCCRDCQVAHWKAGHRDECLVYQTENSEA